MNQDQAADAVAAAEHSAAQQPHESEQENPTAKEKKSDEMRAARIALSKAQAIPEWLQSRWPWPADTMVTHTMHRDSYLPHFQGKLAKGEKFEGKPLSSDICLPLLRFFCQLLSKPILAWFMTSFLIS